MEELDAQKKDEIPKIKVPDTPSITKHTLKINGKTLNYTATTGYITLESETGEENAHIFYIAYTKDGVNDPTTRPVTFSFNGGPGSSSVWLHLGVLGPRRVAMTDDGMSLPPPYQLVDNEQTWLEESDLIFIDPVTTGFSRAAEEKKAKNYHGFRGDINSVGHFIRRYVSDNKRWGSPKYIIGESYGTTRASALSSHLINKYGMYLNGIILVSAITNFQTARFERGNDLPYILFLPTYAASAYYHKKLAKEYLDMELSKFLDEVEVFATGEYTTALMKGYKLGKEERQTIIDKLHQYTGLSKTYIDRADLRINIHKFKKELLRTDYEVIGRFDSRYKMKDMNGNGEYAEMDPSYQPTILGTFGTLINDYLGRELEFSSKLPYNILTGRVHPWDYSVFENKYVNTSENLRKAMIMNPHMKVWIANGYYDLATPYFATEYTMDHLQMEKKLFDNIWMTYYPAGHMMYLLKESLIQMKGEASKFYKDSQKK
ncbi:MAG: peptidase S10 [Aureispira sp.]|nr:peptidase S10 [Aureispira sp.]